MLRLDGRRAELRSFVASEENNPSRFFCVAFEHLLPALSADCRARRRKLPDAVGIIAQRANRAKLYVWLCDPGIELRTITRRQLLMRELRLPLRNIRAFDQQPRITAHSFLHSVSPKKVMAMTYL